MLTTEFDRCVRLAASLCAGLVLAACAIPVSEHHVADKPIQSPPLAVTALGGLLLEPGEIQSLTADSVTGGALVTSMLSNDGLDEKSCAAVDNIAGEEVYAGSGWTAVRRQQLSEPGDDPDHFIQQAVVSFPTADDATDFFTASKHLWEACSNRRYRSATSEEPDVVWTVGPVTVLDGVLSTTEIQEGGEGWNCQRALTAGINVIVDVLACTYGQVDTAVDIARRIGVRLRR